MHGRARGLGEFLARPDRRESAGSALRDLGAATGGVSAVSGRADLPNPRGPRARENWGGPIRFCKIWRSHMIRFGPAEAYEPRPLWEVFDPRSWQANYSGGEFFRDKVVIVGVSAQILHDVVNTPLGPNHARAGCSISTRWRRRWRVNFCTPHGALLGYALDRRRGPAGRALMALLRRPLVSLCRFGRGSRSLLWSSRACSTIRQGFLLLTVPVLAAFLLQRARSLGLRVRARSGWKNCAPGARWSVTFRRIW